jgi:NACalpha-BTF3-like transcription factor
MSKSNDKTEGMHKARSLYGMTHEVKRQSTAPKASEASAAPTKTLSRKKTPEEKELQRAFKYRDSDVEKIMEVGFKKEQAIQALIESDHNVHSAINALIASQEAADRAEARAKAESMRLRKHSLDDHKADAEETSPSLAMMMQHQSPSFYAAHPGMPYQQHPVAAGYPMYTVSPTGSFYYPVVPPQYGVMPSDGAGYQSSYPIEDPIEPAERNSQPPSNASSFYDLQPTNEHL